MPISVIVRVACDVFVRKDGGGPRKKCSRHAEFEGENIVKAKWAAEDAGWRFDTTKHPDKAMCPDCGPVLRPYTYGGRRG